MALYSHSRLDAFENCPLRYKFNYIDKIKRDDQGIEAFMGSRFHDIMEKLYKDIKCKTYSLEELIDYYNEIWDKEYSDNVLIVKKDRTAEDYRNAGKKCIEDYYAHYHPFDQGRVIDVERRVVIDINGDGKYQIQGYIDRLMQMNDGTYEIHDYKTNSRLPEQKKLDEDRQLALYQIGISDMWNDVKDVKLIWHYVMFDKKMVSTRTEEELEALKQQTIDLIDKIESTEEFEPCESTLCGWCSYQDLCPKKKHIYAVSDLPANEYKKEPGVKLVEEYSKLETKKKEIKKQINAIEDEQEKIKEAAIEFAEKEKVSVIDGPSTRMKVDIKKELKAPTKQESEISWIQLRETLIKEGKYEEVSTVHAGMFSKRITNKEWPDEFVEKIKGYLIEKETKSVRLVKKKDE